MDVIGETSKYWYVQAKTDPEKRYKNYVNYHVGGKKIVL